MARTSKYTEPVLQKLEEAIRLGATYELAAKYAGIGESTMYEWLAKRPAFKERIEQAQGVAAMMWLAKIEKAASEGAWQAAAWKLERLHPEMYGRTIQRQEVAGTVQVNHGLALPQDNPEAAAHARALIRSLSAGSLPDASRSGASGE